MKKNMQKEILHERSRRTSREFSFWLFDFLTFLTTPPVHVMERVMGQELHLGRGSGAQTFSSSSACQRNAGCRSGRIKGSWCLVTWSIPTSLAIICLAYLGMITIYYNDLQWKSSQSCRSKRVYGDEFCMHGCVYSVQFLHWGMRNILKLSPSPFAVQSLEFLDWTLGLYGRVAPGYAGHAWWLLWQVMMLNSVGRCNGLRYCWSGIMRVEMNSRKPSDVSKEGHCGKLAK